MKSDSREKKQNMNMISFHDIAKYVCLIKLNEFVVHIYKTQKIENSCYSLTPHVSAGNVVLYFLSL